MMSDKVHIVIFVLSTVLVLSCSKKQLLTTEEEQWLAKNDSISVAIFPYYPPYQYTNKRKTVEGIFLDYLKLIEDKIDYSFYKKQYAEWPLVLDDAKANHIDMILEAQPTEEREEYLRFHDIIFESEFVVVTHKKTPNINTVKDLYGKSIVLPEGFAIVDILQKHAANLKIENCSGDADCLTQINKGNFDGYLGPKAVVNYYKETLKLSNLRIGDAIETSYTPALAVVKENEMLNTIIEKATGDITAAEKRKLINNWLFQIEKPFYLTTGFWVRLTVIIIAAILILFYFNRRLKKMIKIKREGLLRSKKELEADTTLKINFVEQASKNFKAPLKCILEQSEQLLGASKDPAQKTPLLNTIIEEAEKLIYLTDSSLHLPMEASTSVVKKISEQSASGHNPTKTTVSDSKKIDVLIADDNAINYFVLESFLLQIEEYNFNFHKAINGRQAIDIFNAIPTIDLIFMDIRMPIMDGFQATREIRRVNTEVPIIAQTAYATNEYKNRAFKAGCTAFISKPIRPKDLRVTIDSQLAPKSRTA